MIRFFTGKMGCGMGACNVDNLYFNNKEKVLKDLSKLPEECQKCVLETKKDEELLKMVEAGR